MSKLNAGDVRPYFSTQQDKGAPGYPERSGEDVTVVREVLPPERDIEVGDMYVVQFQDGQEIHVFAEEVEG